MSNNPIFLSNTLSKQKEEFKPIRTGEVTMYNCGPTVYDYQHIGNFRAFVFVDTLRRMFEYNDYKVKQIINITDIGHLSGDNEGNADEGEDRMTKALIREGKSLSMESMSELAHFYADRFKEDLIKLNTEAPDDFPFASEHIAEDISLIQTLVDKGFTYKTSDGLYFDTSKMPEYGALGGVSNDDEHSRVGINPEKKNQRDFALWKFNEKLGYDAPWGHGFPGWHIECSAMAMKYLGETIDVHTGGVEHISVHHNNELAQSESATGKHFANYWLHNNHLQVDGGKMGKSVGNAYTLKEIEEKGFSILDLRYFYLSAHYKSTLNFTFESLSGAQTSLKRIVKELSDLPDGGNVAEELNQKFISAINDDLNTAQALALVFEVLKSDISPADKKATVFKFDEFLGLKLREQSEKIKSQNENIPIPVKNLATEREQARANKDFARADLLRAEAKKLGYQIEDSTTGPVITKI